MSWMNRLSPPEPEYTDDEWDQAREQLVDEWMDRGWDREDAQAHVDDWMVAEQCEANRDDHKATIADQLIKRRKEENL